MNARQMFVIWLWVSQALLEMNDKSVYVIDCLSTYHRLYFCTEVLWLSNGLSASRPFM